jgi:uncharacterized protein YxeA
MVDGSKVTSMILMIIIGLVMIVFGGIVIWKYRQDQLLLQSLVAQGQLSAAQLSQFPSAGWTYGLAAAQIILGLILIVWGLIQYFATPKHIDTVKEYVSRQMQPTAVQTVSPIDTVGPTEVKTVYTPGYTGGSRRVVKV